MSYFIEFHIDMRSQERIFPMKRQAVDLYLKRMQKDLKFKIHAHKFRHTYAKNLLRSGVDIETIRIMLGHEDLGTTQIYTVLGADEALERMKRIDVKFVKMERWCKTIKPNTTPSGPRGI
ncbi:hypothetical site-specific integrase/recombinase [Picrophilus oshimae DSM 9789]|uniref:Hypothetical site-specific integrase/recombinase n=2 Tax=Picrophilus oshimae TaxID=46632 RepID=Q6L100_PICTO|nr:hypothetical site-specific integrase/recombinase [Picrophilus oshimae DSM 9789]